MTKDIVVVSRRMPDTWRLLAGLYAAGPDQYLASVADGAVIQLTGTGGRPLVSVEAPVLVQVPGETARLLGRDAARAEPVWWTEVRASTAVPEAATLAGSVAGRLALLLDGACHPAQAVTTLGVVPVESGVAAAPAPHDALPAVDVVTDKAAVVISDRSPVALSAWLSDVLRVCAATDRALQIVSPPGARLSLPVRLALGGHPNRWVVGDSSGYYDGLSGAELHWHDGAFTPLAAPDGAGRVAPAFRPSAPAADRQFTVSYRTLHAPDAGLAVGASVEAAWRELTGAPPAGWGTAEPVNLPWSPRQLTELARERAPRPTFLTVTGHRDRPALAVLRISRTAAGVEEDVTLAIGHGPGEELPLDKAESLARALVARHGLASMVTGVRAARRDLTVPAAFEAPPVPVSYTLGSAAVAETTLTHARRPPLPGRPVQLGAAGAPALHYPLGDGTDAASWAALEILTTHLARRRD
ncbi:DUF6177 family protein [Streptomyces sp. NPDC047002]|uniref:DUF6177 family protein n=1 Tax=Streptomyces sp. NPDC047002 TaxID=3155475 RepID=UPI0034512214